MNLRLDLHIVFLFLISSLVGCEKQEKKFVSTVYGHAGTGDSEERWTYPPNTEEAILYAINVMDSDGVEVDVRFSSDSVAMVFHDSDLSDKTNGTGCLEYKTAAELETLEFFGKYRIMRLETVVGYCIQRNKFLFIDIKPGIICNEGLVTADLINKAVNDALADATESDKTMMTISSVDYGTIAAIEDTSLIKGFEAKTFEECYTQWQFGELDKLVLNYKSVSEEQAQQLRDEDIPYCLFGMKTQTDIRKGHNLLPNEMIVDNIAFAQKLMK